MIKTLGNRPEFLKHVAEIPRELTAKKNILAIQINLKHPNDPKPDSKSARELLECLLVIKRSVLVELKKLLPDI